MLLPIQSYLRSIADPKNATVSSRFFKTGIGEYGEGDIFLGIPVGDTRKAVQSYISEATFETVEVLLGSEYHEERLAGVLILVEWAKKRQVPIPEIASFYMQHHERINNWDIVDTSAEHIIGPYIENHLTHEERVTFIESCITSEHLWTNRIIILASFYQIKQGNEKLTFYIVPRFLTHPHDLIHKACGWMLREVGKRVNEEKLCEFLDTYSAKMPRTMLRYAIERLDGKKESTISNDKYPLLWYMNYSILFSIVWIISWIFDLLVSPSRRTTHPEKEKSVPEALVGAFL